MKKQKNIQNFLKAAIAFSVALAFVMPGSAVFASIDKQIDISFDDATYINKRGTEETTGIDWWPMFHHDLNNTGYSTSTGPETNNILWRYQTGDTVSSSPAIVDGKVYIGSHDGYFYCLDAATGTYIWSTTICPDSSPAVADGKVYIGSGDFNIYCLNAETGDILWNYPTGYYVGSSPAVDSGKVYIGSLDNYFYCLDAETGYLIWNYETGDQVRSSPAVADGKVYFGSFDTNVYCLDAETGDLVWNYTTGFYVQSSPAVTNGKVYVGSQDYYVYCLDAATGNCTWKFKTGERVISSPAVANGKVYVGSDDGRVYCLDAATGNCTWYYETQYHIWTSSPAVADGKVYIGSGDFTVYCLNAITGDLIWNYETGFWIESSPAIANGLVYIGSDDGYVYCFGQEMPYLTIESITGGRGVTAVIKNSGSADATGVVYNITIDGGLIIIPRTDSGDIGTLAPGQSANITFRPIGIGLGFLTPMPTITVTAECAEGSSAEKTTEARIILFFILLPLEIFTLMRIVE